MPTPDKTMDSYHVHICVKCGDVCDCWNDFCDNPPNDEDFVCGACEEIQ